MQSPFFGFVCFFIFGIWAGKFLPDSWAVSGIAFGLAILAACWWANRLKVAVGFLCASFFLLGALYPKSFAAVSLNDVSLIGRYYFKTPVSIEGVIASDVEKRDFFKSKKTTFILEVKNFQTKWGWKRKTGKVLVNIFKDVDLRYGDYVLLKGKLHRPFNFQPNEKFSYPEYLRHKGVHFILSVGKEKTIQVLSTHHGKFIEALAFKARGKFRDVLIQYLSPKESGIMRALLLGERVSMDPQINELFIRTGTAHVIAISGLHVTIVSVLFFVLLKIFPIGRRNQYLLTVALLVFYTFLTGCRPSVVRATIMAVVFLFSFLLEKESQPLNSLSFAALLILLFNPFYLYDIGFQLSFVSVLFIIRLYPRWLAWMSRFIKKEAKVLNFFGQSLGVSLSAWLGVAGLILYQFEILTPVSVIANLVIVPLSSLAIILGMGLLGIGLISPALGVLFSYCVKFTLNLMVVLTFMFDQLPLSCFYFKAVHWGWALGYYGVLGLLFWLWQGTRRVL